jgi:DeoR family fructose operon transcriptional repressor
MTSVITGNSAQLPARRRADLLEFIRQQGQATVVELSETFNVSLDTVRRDLDQLSDLGSITRTHGGAIPTEDLPAVDTPFTARLGANAEAKNRIAAAAARYVGDGQTLVVNGGTTTLAMMPHLADRTDLRIITNNLLIPRQVPENCYREMRFVGGSIRVRSWVTLGERGVDGRKLHLPSNPDATVTSVIGVGSVS